ncbi:hypothetical protein HU230_0002400 [Bradyrhizobium quebecense]|uniref:Uncharacterized protein n=1 Tax=Bradyrhizobium quebecense TaxID=2748629 RepID=A0A974AGJ4_9BRAD|nr:hypothetical protein [Bradyrhizobium quebecense]UGA44914.1 hypothetical protein HU230_0002400 [Bradyrhizobium quebecense]
MQKIAAAFERRGALSLALCCNISAFGEKFCGSSNRHDSAGKLPLLAAVRTAKDARLTTRQFLPGRILINRMEILGGVSRIGAPTGMKGNRHAL